MSIVRALAAGAAGYIPKTHKPPLIMAALRLVAEGGIYIPPEALRETERSCLFTARQLDVLRLIAEGLANKEIARLYKESRWIYVQQSQCAVKS